jgi:hypothetical protein
MAGHSNTKGNRSFLKSQYTANKSKGEKLISAEFKMTFDGYDGLSVLVRTAQLPEMTREDVEDYGPNGLKFNQHGPVRNSGETQVQCVETISGDILQFIKDRITAKDYVDITIAATPESNGGDAADATTVYMDDCKIYCDAIDLSTEDVTALVRPSLRIVYNWIDWD